MGGLHEAAASRCAQLARLYFRRFELAQLTLSQCDGEMEQLGHHTLGIRIRRQWYRALFQCGRAHVLRGHRPVLAAPYSLASLAKIFILVSEILGFHQGDSALHAQQIGQVGPEFLRQDTLLHKPIHEFVGGYVSELQAV